MHPCLQSNKLAITTGARNHHTYQLLPLGLTMTKQDYVVLPPLCQFSQQSPFKTFNPFTATNTSPMWRLLLSCGSYCSYFWCSSATLLRAAFCNRCSVTSD